MSAARWPRRTVLVLGLSALTVGVTGTQAPAAGTPVRVGDLTFEVPSEVQPAPSVPGVSESWTWQGMSAATVTGPGMIVLARADVDSTDAEEVLGLLMAGVAIGQLPGLLTEAGRTRTVGAGQGDQVRTELSYQVSRRVRYRGSLLVATRRQPPAAALVVLGDDTLTAGTVDAVLDSVRWTS